MPPPANILTTGAPRSAASWRLALADSKFVLSTSGLGLANCTEVATAAISTDRVLLFETDLAEQNGAFHAYFVVIPELQSLEHALAVLGMA